MTEHGTGIPGEQSLGPRARRKQIPHRFQSLIMGCQGGEPGNAGTGGAGFQQMGPHGALAGAGKGGRGSPAPHQRFRGGPQKTCDQVLSRLGWDIAGGRLPGALPGREKERKGRWGQSGVRSDRCTGLRSRVGAPRGCGEPAVQPRVQAAHDALRPASAVREGRGQLRGAALRDHLRAAQHVAATCPPSLASP